MDTFGCDECVAMDVGVFVLECILSSDKYMTFKLFEYGLSPLFYIVLAIWVPCECYEVLPDVAGFLKLGFCYACWTFSPVGCMLHVDVEVGDIPFGPFGRLEFERFLDALVVVR